MSKKRVGRPLIGDHPMQYVTIRLPIELIARIKKHHKPFTAWIRQAVVRAARGLK